MNPTLSENFEDRTPRGNAVGLAATVVLLRDSDAADRAHSAADGAAGLPSGSGIEVLLLERPRDRGSFAGAWVFPGGAVDEADLIVVGAGLGAALGRERLLDLSLRHEEAATRRAAARETFEETGLVVNEQDLRAVARWHPPLESPKPLRTWFYLAAAPSGQMTLEPHEAIDYRWLTPDAALEQHAQGALTLFPPTWVTLHGLLGMRSVSAALQQYRAAERAEFATRFGPGMSTAFWSPDAAYGEQSGEIDAAQLLADGPRHRLEMSALPWKYERENPPVE